MSRLTVEEVIRISQRITDLRASKLEIEANLKYAEERLEAMFKSEDGKKPRSLTVPAPDKDGARVFSTHSHPEKLSRVLYEEMVSHPTLKQFTFDYLCKAATNIRGYKVSKLSVRAALGKVGVGHLGKNALVRKIQPRLYVVAKPVSKTSKPKSQKRTYLGSRISPLHTAVKNIFLDTPLEMFTAKDILGRVSPQYPSANYRKVNCICYRLWKHGVITRKSLGLFTIGPDVVKDTIESTPKER